MVSRALGVPLRPTIFDFDSTSLDPAEFMQASHKRGSPLDFGGSRVRAEVSNDWRFAACCARVLSGHAAAAPLPRRVMNSRRLIASPRDQHKEYSESD